MVALRCSILTWLASIAEVIVLIGLLSLMQNLGLGWVVCMVRVNKTKTPKHVEQVWVLCMSDNQREMVCKIFEFPKVNLQKTPITSLLYHGWKRFISILKLDQPCWLLVSREWDTITLYILVVVPHTITYHPHQTGTDAAMLLLSTQFGEFWGINVEGHFIQILWAWTPVNKPVQNSLLGGFMLRLVSVHLGMSNNNTSERWFYDWIRILIH